MTDRNRRSTDPLRALDHVPPPDRWDDIVARATDGDPSVPPVPSSTHRSRRPLLLAAAALLVATAIVGGFALATGQDEPPDQVVAGPSATSTPDDRPEVSYLRSGGAGCEIGLDPSVELETSGPLGPGAAVPPVLEEAWSAQRGSATHGVWNVTGDDQRIEIDVPGLVVIDLVGERTEQVRIGDHGEATVWYSDGWVQVRYFSGHQEALPCDSFTVTAVGGSETANRDAAVAVATSLSIRELTEAEGRSSVGTDPAGRDDPPPATIPPRDADGEDLQLSEWTGMIWALEAIEVDGMVRHPSFTPLGATDGVGGPIVIEVEVAEGTSRLVVRGCEELVLDLRERDGRPWIALPPERSSFDGCDGEGGRQWGDLLKILSAGAVPRMVETDHGPVLFVANEEGAAAFWHP